VQFFHHDFVMSVEFFEEFVEVAFFGHGSVPGRR
jgi:hypothetical protein